jgi:hypothetical protein
MKIALSALLLIGLASILGSGCADEAAQRHREMELLSARHEAELRHYEDLRAQFAERNPCPKKIEFPGQGTVIVHECSLRGLPGREEFWIKYTYLNSTGRGIESAHILIKVQDAYGNERTDSSDARLPLGLRLGPDSSYTTFTQIGLEGLSKIGELEWTIEVVAAG